MAITLEVWEDTGAPTGSPARGTTRQEVDNLGWKDSALDETYTFVDYPIVRPYNTNVYTTSYTKYYYFKIQGTYDYAHNLMVNFSGNPVGAGGGSGIAPGVRVYYKWTNTYAAPSTNILNGTLYTPANPPTWTPLLSTGGPQNPGVWTPVLSPDTTYYTAYLVTQLYVEPGAWNDYGNLTSTFKLEMTLDERKSGLPGYDPALVNWTW